MKKITADDVESHVLLEFRITYQTAINVNLTTSESIQLLFAQGTKLTREDFVVFFLLTNPNPIGLGRGLGLVYIYIEI